MLSMSAPTKLIIASPIPCRAAQPKALAKLTDPLTTYERNKARWIRISETEILRPSDTTLMLYNHIKKQICTADDFCGDDSRYLLFYGMFECVACNKTIYNCHNCMASEVCSRPRSSFFRYPRRYACCMVIVGMVYFCGECCNSLLATMQFE